MSFGLAYVAY